MNLSHLTSEYKKSLNIPDDITGIVVTHIEKKSVAGKNGIRKKDIINSANQRILKTPEDLFNIINEAKSHKRKSIMLLIYRAGGNVFLSLPID